MIRSIICSKFIRRAVVRQAVFRAAGFAAVAILYTAEIAVGQNTFPELDTGSSVTWNTTLWTLGGLPPQTATQVGLLRGGGTMTIDDTSTNTTPGGLLIGWNGNFSVNMTSGTLTVGATAGDGQAAFGLTVGESGTGNFAQTGGLVTAPLVNLGRHPSTPGVGTYTLSGGTLATAAILLRGPGSGTFNFNGGTIEVSGTAANLIASSITTNVQAGGALIDTNGFNATIASPLAGAGGLTKSGSGTLTLSAASSYTGGTTISGGRLEIAPTGALAATGTVTINGLGAELRYNASSALTAPLTFTQGTISGTGTIGTAVNVGSGRILSPGNSPGVQAYSSGLTWSPLGTYKWEINDAAGVAGTNWDLLQVSGSALDLSGLSSENRFNLDLTTLTGTAGGQMANYVDGQSYTFSLATYASLDLPNSFSGNDLTSLFNPSFSNWQNPAPSLANVSIVNDAATSTINLVIVPEPSAVALLAAAAAAAALPRVRRRTRNA